jgi:hypothetical protein
VGEWRYVTHATDPLLDQRSGTIECTASRSKGFVYQSGRHFYYEDGTPFFRMGDTCWRLFRSKNAPFDTHFKPYIDARAEQGFNYIQAVIHTLGEPSINEGGSLWENDTDLDRLNPDYFEWIDKRIEYMLDRGIVPGLFLVWADTFDDFYQSPYDRDTFSRFRRYVVARYWAYNVFWILSGEYTESMTPDDYHYHADIITFGNDAGSHGLYDIGDPYGHPLSIHPEGQQSNSQHYELFGDWLGFTMQQIYGSPKYLNAEIEKDYQMVLPVCNDEFGYEGPTDPNDPRYDKSNQTARDARKDAWAIVCSGAYFSFGNIYTYTGREYSLDINHLDSPGATFMEILGDYMRTHVNFTDMQPAQELVVSDGVYCLAEKGKEYLFYFPHDGTYEFQLDADELVFNARWLNPETGETFMDVLFFGDMMHQKQTPFPDDALLHLYNPRDASLAIELVSFTAVSVDSAVHIEWQTSAETNTAGFILERAEGAHNFIEITSFVTNPQLAGRGSSTHGHLYSFTDFQIDQGVTYLYRLTDVDVDGRRSVHKTISTETSAVGHQQTQKNPAVLELFSNYPNPFNSATLISFYLPEQQDITLSIYNSLGQSVWHKQMLLPSGHHRVHWTGTTTDGHPLGSGLYICELRSDSRVLWGKMLLLP